MQALLSGFVLQRTSVMVSELALVSAVMYASRSASSSSYVIDMMYFAYADLTIMHIACLYALAHSVFASHALHDPHCACTSTPATSH